MSEIISPYNVRNDLGVGGNTILNGNLSVLGNITSPNMTGIPLTTTATPGTNTAQVASTAFVGTAIANLVASAPSTLDTLNELAAALGDDPNFATTMTNTLASKANLAGATFTGAISIDNTSTTANTTAINFFDTSGNYGIGMGPTNTQGMINFNSGTGNNSYYGFRWNVNGTQRATLDGTGLFNLAGALTVGGGATFSNTSLSSISVTNINAVSIGADAANIKLVSDSQYPVSLIAFIPTGSPGVDTVGFRLTTNNGGSNTVEAFRALPSGRMLFGTTTDDGVHLLQVNGGISATSVTSSGAVTANQNYGFVSATDTANARNPIWSFGTFPTYGLSYFQGTSGYGGGGDSIGFHFGTATAAASPLNITTAGIVVTGSSIFSARPTFNGNTPYDTGNLTIGNYATLASPSFSGVPLAPTAAVNTNTTQIATTAYYINQGSSVTPIVASVGTVGVSNSWARADHVHPTDTTGARNAISVTGAGGSYNSSTGVITITGAVSSVQGRTGAVTLVSADITGALGFTPYNSTNPSAYISLGSISVTGPGGSYNSSTGVINITGAVTSVATRTGAVVLSNTDISGLGTSATINTGTSGATIPLLNGTNTWSGVNTFSTPIAITSGGTGSSTATGSGSVVLATSPTVSGLTNTGNITTGGASGISYIITPATNTGTGALLIQAGAGSATYGGSLTLYSNANATHPGDVVASVSSSSGGSFRINSAGNDSGTTVFSVVGSNGNTSISGLITTNGGITSNGTSTFNSGLLNVNLNASSIGSDAAKLTLSSDVSYPVSLISFIPTGSPGIDLVGFRLTVNNGGANTVEAFRANPSGHMLFGTTTDNGSAFQVNGTATFASTVTVGIGGSSAINTVITINGTSNSAYGAVIQGQRAGSNAWLIGDVEAAIGSGTGYVEYVYGANPWIVYNNGTESGRFSGAGNFLLGTTTDGGSKLQVNGAATISSTLGVTGVANLGAAVNATGLVTASTGVYIAGAATLGTSNNRYFSFEYPITRFYIGDGTGYSFSFSKRVASVTTDLVTINDAGVANFVVGPTAPTASIGTSTTQLSTTAFVQNLINSSTSISVAGGSNVTLTATQASNGILLLTGVLTANINVIVPASSKDYIVSNRTTGNYTLTVTTAGGTGIVAVQGANIEVFCDGTNVVQSTTALGPGTITYNPVIVATAGQTIFPVASGYATNLIMVFVNGYKLPPADYTAVNGTSITLTVASTAGEQIETVAFSNQAMGALSTIVRTPFTATDQQTTFSVTYPVGMILVSARGDILPTSDYTATNGTSVVFNNGLPAGLTGEFIVFSAINLSNAVNTSGGVMTGDLTVPSLNGGGQLAGFRNRIINGDMRVPQRGTSYALTSTQAYGSLDRWSVIQNTTANGVFNQVAGSNGFQYFAKLGRNSGATTTGNLVMIQALESINSIPLQGQTVTLSFYAKAGANFSAASNLIGVNLYTGTGTDQAASSIASWTGVAIPINTTQAITTTLTRYTFTTVLSSTATQVGAYVFYTPTGTAGADDNLYITGVQLEVGSVATPYEQIPYGVQLGMCQRYYENLYNVSTFACNGTTSLINGIVKFSTTKRANPTFAYTGTLVTQPYDYSVSGVSVNSSTPNEFVLGGVSSTLTVGSSYQVAGFTSMTASAEL